MCAPPINEIFAKKREFYELQHQIKVTDLREGKEGTVFLNRINERKAKKEFGKRKEKIRDEWVKTFIHFIYILLPGVVFSLFLICFGLFYNSWFISIGGFALFVIFKMSSGILRLWELKRK